MANVQPQYVNLGSPNQGNGDPLRQAFDKSNKNFSNIFNTGIANTSLEFQDETISNPNGNILFGNLAPAGFLRLSNVTQLRIPGAAKPNQFIVSLDANNPGNVAWGNGVTGPQWAVQFNNNNSFTGTSGLTYSTANATLTVASDIVATGQVSASTARIGTVPDAPTFEINSVGNVLIRGSLQVLGVTTVDNITVGNVANRVFIVASDITNASDPLLNGSGIQIGNIGDANTGVSNITVLYNSVSNTVAFSREISTPSGFNTASLNSSSVQSLQGDFDLVIARDIVTDTITGDFGDLGQLLISNTAVATARNNNSRFLRIRNDAPNADQYSTLQLSVANSISANAGFWDVSADSIRGNLTFGRYTGNDNTADSTPAVWLASDGQVYARGYNLLNGDPITGGGFAAGSNGQIQYNVDGFLTGSNNLVYTYADNRLDFVGDLNIVGQYLVDNVAIATQAAGLDGALQFANGISVNGSNALRFFSESNTLALIGNLEVSGFYTTPDVWVPASNVANSDVYLNAVVYDPVGNQWFAGGQAGNILQANSNLYQWSRSAINTGGYDIGTMAAGGGVIVAGVQLPDAVTSTAAFYSTDSGQTWSNSSLFQSGLKLNGGFYSQGAFALVGYRPVIGAGDEIWYSVNGGRTYTIATTPSGETLRDITSSGPLWVSVGGDATAVVLNSTNLDTWANVTLPVIPGGIPALYATTWGKNIFVAGGNSGAVLTSLDGYNWRYSRLQPGSLDDIRAIEFQNGFFLAASRQGNIYISYDGVVWQSQDSGIASPRGSLLGLGTNSNTAIAVGSNANITVGNIDFFGGGYAEFADVVSGNIATPGNLVANTVYTDNIFTRNGQPLGVSRIIAGTNITISSTGADGTGNVTINSAGGGGGGGGAAMPAGPPGSIQFNATTGSSNVLGGSANLNWYNNINTLELLGNLDVDVIDNDNLNVRNINATGNVTLGNVGDVHIRGGSSGYALVTDGTGNLQWQPRSLNANVNTLFEIPTASEINSALPPGYTPLDGSILFDTNSRATNIQPFYIYGGGSWRQILTSAAIE